MQRVLVIGPCGAGKSTLAVELASKLKLPLFHMDKLSWKPGWVDSSDEELREKLAAITCTDHWIIDGNYGGTLQERLDRADTVIYLDFPIRLCLWRVVRRVAKYRGRTRPDMTEGCPERFDIEFFVYLMRWNNGPRLRTEERLRDYTVMLIRLKNPAELSRWIRSLPS